MANNPQSFTRGSVLMVDPNPPNNELVSSEDLNIIVELETINKPRSAINVISENDIEISSNNPDTIRVNFINGTNINGKQSLTTNYTEIGTEFGEQNADLETFGITSIDIDFNSSYAPIVKINFTDIRGRLFELGNDSPYNVFFTLPYPIFKLKVKGFYGKSVTYCLHLVNFNAEFDSKTGNFNVVGEFIGYTYALLSDMLLGYLKAIPETSFANRIINQSGNNFLKLNELTERVSDFNREIGNLRQDNEKIQELAKNEELKLKLLDLRTTINNSLDDLIVQTDGSNNNLGFLLLRQPVNANEISIINGKLDVLRSKIDDEIDNFNNGTPENLRLNSSDFLITQYDNLKKREFSNGYFGNNPNIRNNEELIHEIQELFLFVPRVGPEQNMKVINIETGISTIRQYIETLENNIETLKEDVGLEIQTRIEEIFGFTPGVKNFIGILTAHVELLLDSIRDVSILAENNLSERRRLVINRFEDNFSDIRNIDNVFAFPEYTKSRNGIVEDAWIGNDFPSFPEVRLVEEILEGLLLSKKRDNEVLNNLISGEESWYPINPFDNELLSNNQNPWITIKNGNTTEVLRLMLLRAMLFISHSNNNLTNDEILAMARIEANNAFNSIENKSVKNAINFYKGNTNPNTISNQILNEALNVNTVSSNGEALDEPTFANSELDVNNGGIFQLFNSSTGFIDVGDPDPNSFYEYRYISGAPNSGNEDERKFYIPLYGPYNGSNISNQTDTQRISLRESGNIFFGNYIGANSSSDAVRVDDGATYLRIIDSEDYFNNISNLPNYGTEILSSLNINSGSILNEASINSSDNTVYNTLGGRLGFQEFLEYGVNEPIDGDTKLPTWLLFYEDYNRTEPIITVRRNLSGATGNIALTSEFDIPATGPLGVIPNVNTHNISTLLNLREEGGASTTLGKHKFELWQYNKNRNLNINVPFLTYRGNLFRVSLFGSHFYYQQQTEQAKAFLFLNTLPFNGFNIEAFNFSDKGLFSNDNIKGLFNKRSGYINAPKSWVLYMGGLLWRKSQTTDPISFTYTNNDNEISLIKSVNLDDLEIPTVNQYLATSDNGLKQFNFGGTDDVVDHEEIINKLPVQVKNEFINKFLSWSNSIDGWLRLKEKLEIFVPNTTINQILSFWLNFDESNVANNLTNPILKTNLRENYIIFSRDVAVRNARGNRLESLENVTDVNTAIQTLVDDDVTATPFNFFLEARDNSDLAEDVINFLVETQIIVNSTWRIWADNDLDGFIFDDRIDSLAPPHRAASDKIGNYVQAFIQEFINLNQDVTNDETDELKRQLFNTINNDDIKISIYKNLKSIYDKWVCGSENAIFFCGTDAGNGDRALIDSFRFIDRAFNDIGDEFKINPIDLTKLIESNYNQSFYDFVSTLLRDNNFDFIPLPTFIDYNDEEEIKDVFRTFSYSEDVTTSGPQFVCMYIGERSGRLDLNDSSYSDSGFSFRPENDDSDLPNDFSTGGTTPVVLVNYSSQNQSIFKNLKLNQKEFTETNESLWVTDEISRRGSPTNRTGVGQNLYQIYLTRSYSCAVEAMGNAQIQPFMYFQLNNVPMFRGAYAIIHVNHKIVPHNMTTTFKGVRIKKPRTALVKDDSIYINLIGSLSDINVNGFNLEDSNLARARGGGSANSVDDGDSLPLSPFITYQVQEGPGISYQAPSIANTAYALEEIRDILEQVGLEFNNKAKTLSHGDTIFINDLSKRLGGRIPQHQSHRKGIDADVRPIINSKNIELTNTSQSNYSREGTRLLIQTLIDVSNRYNVPLDVIFFQDDVLISEFPNLVRSIPNHDDHLHIRWTIPQRIQDEINNNDVNVDDNFDDGLLEKIPFNQRANKQARLNSLGKI